MKPSGSSSGMLTIRVSNRSSETTVASRSAIAAESPSTLTLTTRRTSPGSRPAASGGLVDRALHCENLVGSHPTQARQPAVGDGTGQPQHPRPVGADPEPDPVCGLRPGLGAA